MIAKTPDEVPEPARWSDSPSESGTAEQAIGVAFRRVREATEPSDTAVASVGRRLSAEDQVTRGRMLWRLAIAAALIMATGGAVGAALHRWRRAEAVAPQSAAPAPDERSAAARSHRRRRHAVPGVAEPEGSADVEASPEVPAPEAPAPVAPALEPPAPAPVAVAPIATESRPPSRAHRAAGAASESAGAAIIADAFRDLRSRGDAAAALRSLDDYDRRFPNGVLRAESRVARVEALLMLDRRAEALQLLEAVGSGARADLTRYLSLHADGPSAAAARRALVALP